MLNNHAMTEATVHITTERPGAFGSGTGFLFGFQMTAEDYAPVLFTNKHVVQDRRSVTFSLSTSPVGNPDARNGICTLTISDHWQDIWIPHPDANVDLGCFAFAGLLNRVQAHGVNGYGHMFTERDLLTTSEYDQLSSVEDILMIGYPKGRYDQKNNRPLVRKGITASDIRLDYNGKREFMIDCATYHGSSGSPIVLRELPIWRGPGGVISGGRRGALVGVLYAGPVFDAAGQAVDLKGEPLGSAVVQQFMNLGSVIDARRLSEFKPLLSKLPATERTKCSSNFTAI